VRVGEIVPCRRSGTTNRNDEDVAVGHGTDASRRIRALAQSDGRRRKLDTNDLRLRQRRTES